MDDEKQLLQQAQTAIRSGNKTEGRRLLLQVIRQYPKSETAWLWLSAIVDDPTKEQDCLRRVLVINPRNEIAQRHLAKQNEPAKPLPQATAAPFAPCPYCGQQIRESMTFCGYCGRNLETGRPPSSAKPIEQGNTSQEKLHPSAVHSKRKKGMLALILIGAALILVFLPIGLCVLSSFLPRSSRDNSPVLTREQVYEARKHFRVEVISFDASQEYGVEFPYSDYLRLRITNNSNVTLPYLTVLTQRYDKFGKKIGSSRAPSIPTSNLRPGESVEVDYYPRGHLPGVAKIDVEIEQLIDEESMQFFKEFE